MALIFRLVPRIGCSVAVAGLLVMAGCKPSSTPKADRTLSSSDDGSGGHSPRQPSASDFNSFLQTLLQSSVKVADLKTDPPSRMPNTSADGNAWIINVKLTLAPTEDLLALPSSEDARVIDNLAAELNALIGWHNAYVRSPYVHTYGSFEVAVPAAPAPQLLVVRQPKGKALNPQYGKVAAEWQVDHWAFTNVDMELPTLGQPRASFPGSTMVKSSPEAEAWLAAERRAITEAKQKQAVIEGNYLKDLLAAVQPGTLYTGKISHRLGSLPCELRFLGQPPGDTQTTMFEVRLTSEPSYQFTYSAKLVTPLPLGVPVPSGNGESFNVPDDSTALSAGNLTVNFVRGSGGGKDEDGKTLPGMILRGQRGKYTPRDQPFVVLGHQLHGLVSKYTNGEFDLTAEQKR